MFLGSLYGEFLASGSLPDAQITPGATLDVTKEDVCTPGYTKKVRNVPIAVKRHVYEEYGIQYVPRAYEVDHLISLELGGSNSMRNLWPEPYEIRWNAHVKDALENRLHVLVCDGAISLETAQREIADNWIEAYQHTFIQASRSMPNQSSGGRITGGAGVINESQS